MLPEFSRRILSYINRVTRVGQPRASHTEPLSEPPYVTPTQSCTRCGYSALAIPCFCEVDESG